MNRLLYSAGVDGDGRSVDAGSALWKALDGVVVNFDLALLRRTAFPIGRGRRLAWMRQHETANFCKFDVGCKSPSETVTTVSFRRNTEAKSAAAHRDHTTN